MSVRTVTMASVLALTLVSGCQTGGTKHDLDALSGKIRTGMSELEVTRDAGAPTRVEIDGDERRLRYEAKEGSGVIVVTLKQNVVIGVERKG